MTPTMRPSPKPRRLDPKACAVCGNVIDPLRNSVGWIHREHKDATHPAVPVRVTP